jgi:hypothetical protein
MSQEKSPICSKCNIEKLDNETEGFVEIKPDDETPKTHCCESITPALVEEKKEATTSIPKLHQEIRCLEELCETEGILTALETAHAYAAAKRWAADNPGKRILIGNSGRGDKDMPTLTKYPVRTRANVAA